MTSSTCGGRRGRGTWGRVRDGDVIRLRGSGEERGGAREGDVIGLRGAWKGRGMT